MSEARQRQHLCPKCMSPLRQNIYECSVCRLEFKNPQQAVRRSLLCPVEDGSMQDIRCWDPLCAGRGRLLVEIILIVTESLPTGRGGGMAPVIYVLFVFGLEKLLAIHHIRGQWTSTYSERGVRIDQNLRALR